MKLGVIVPTYQRKDGKTFEMLTRALMSIKNQTYNDYVVYLIGDKYNNNDEFEMLANTIIDKNNMKYINLPHAVEREKYNVGSRELWCAGGVNAINVGINMALADGFSFICHLDHDDYWENNHLEEINYVIENNKNKYAVIATNGITISGFILPRNHHEKYYPTDSDVFHSSICVNFKQIPLRYRDVFVLTGRPYAADADLWNRISIYMKERGLIGYHINKITCHNTGSHNINN